MAVPAHQPFLDTTMSSDSDEELSDEQVLELLTQAEQRMQSQAGAQSDAPFRLPKLDPGHIVSPYLRTEGSITRLDPSQVVDPKTKALAGKVKKVEDPIAVKKQQKEERKATAGSDWFNLPKTDVTPELRRDLQLLKMRGVIDPKRHYKKSDSKSDVPAYSHVGTIIEGPTEFYSARIQNKDRKKTFVEEVLSQEAETGRFKKKYNEIQTSKTSGKKAFYKALKAKRKGRVEKR